MCSRILQRTAALVTLALAWWAWAAGRCGAEDLRVADFEGGLPAGLRSSGGTARHGSDPAEAAEGKGFLRLRMDSEAKQMVFRVALGAGIDPGAFASLAVSLRAPPTGRPLPMRWYALDEAGRPLFQRRFELASDGRWTRAEEPLALWRWGNQEVGRWDRVKALALAIEGPTSELLVDDLRLAGAQDDHRARPAPQWLLDAAFPQGGAKAVAEDGFLVASDAPEASEADLRTVLAQMRRVRAWVGRVFAGAVQPPAADRPITMFIFASDEEYRGFFKRLGAAWRAEIVPPKSSGYTVEDITAATWSAQYGADRPVYLHEAVHAVAVRCLGVRLEVEDRAWFHEGLANYVQLCVYPGSLDWETYRRNFATPVAADASGFFKPLEGMMTRRVSTGTYAQLASLIAFLAEERPEWLPKIARGLAEGRPVSEVLKACGTDFAGLQAEWFAWGEKRFAGGRSAARFDLPKEWSEEQHVR